MESTSLEKLAETSKLNTELIDAVAILNIKNAKIEYSGEYRLTLENKVGILNIPVIVRVQDRPSAPRGPVLFSDVTSDSVSLKWQLPEF